MRKLAYTAVLAAALVAPALAADAPPPPKLEPIPEIPPPANATEPAIEEGSEVVTRQDGELRIEEFRRKGGKLYLVKITPRVGAPYYLVDPSDYTTAPSADGRDKAQRAPAWIIKSW